MSLRIRSILFLHLFLFILVGSSATKTWAAPGPSVSSRLDSLEAGWGHIRMGGDFSLRGDIYSGSPFASQAEDGGNSIPGFQQDMKFRLEAQASKEFSLDLLLSHTGFWGVSMPSDGNMDKPPMMAPLIIDEAAIRYRKPQMLGDFGRFRFSLDPMGLITDHTSYPIEGGALQTNINGTYLGGFFSRVGSAYQLGNLHVVSADEELALRVAWPRPTYLLGLTWQVNGLAKESAWAIDYTGWLGRHGFRMTAAFYKPDSTVQQQLNQDGGWGYLAQGDLIAGEKQTLSLKLGYFQPGFTPTFSRLANAYTGTDGEPFSSNTKGFGLYYNRSLNRLWDVSVETTIVKAVDFSLMTEAGQHSMWNWEIRSIRRFSPTAYLEMGYESPATALGREAHLYAGLNLHF